MVRMSCTTEIIKSDYEVRLRRCQHKEQSPALSSLGGPSANLTAWRIGSRTWPRPYPTPQIFLRQTKRFNLRSRSRIASSRSQTVGSTMSWPTTPGTNGLHEGTPAQSPSVTGASASNPRKRKKSVASPDDDDRDQNDSKGKNQPVKRACNECRQQKVKTSILVLYTMSHD